jgi:hypothetical protein
MRQTSCIAIGLDVRPPHRDVQDIASMRTTAGPGRHDTQQQTRKTLIRSLTDSLQNRY